jgi:hypothetical protein
VVGEALEGRTWIRTKGMDILFVVWFWIGVVLDRCDFGWSLFVCSLCVAFVHSCCLVLGSL